MSIYTTSIALSKALGTRPVLIPNDDLLEGLGESSSSPVPPWNKGKKLEDWDRKKKSDSRKLYLKNNPTAREKLLEYGKKGLKKSVEVNSKKYIVTFPDGHEEEIVSLNSFCKKHNLNQGNMSSVANGKLKSHKKFSVRFC